MNTLNREQGYGIFTADGSSFYIPKAEHIERIDENMIFESDNQAAIQAEKDGVNFIYDIKGVPHRTYIDTPENRAIINDFLKSNPNYIYENKDEAIAHIYPNVYFSHHKENSLWYGGDIAEISYKGFKFIITANGDTRGDIYINGEIVHSFKDKRNQGNLGIAIEEYTDIRNDKDLEKCLTRDYVTDDMIKDIPTLISLDNSNWWEVYTIHNNIAYDLEFDLNTTHLKEALLEIEEDIDCLYKYLLEIIN